METNVRKYAFCYFLYNLRAVMLPLSVRPVVRPVVASPVRVCVVVVVVRPLHQARKLSTELFFRERAADKAPGDAATQGLGLHTRVDLLS